MIRPADPTPAPAEGVTLVLPRPNLGPEPWAEPPTGWITVELVGLGILAVGLAGLAIRRRGRRQPRADSPPTPNPTAAGDPTPNRRLIASAAPVRAALIAEFGAAWGSRTTEEIAADPALGARLGPEAARQFVGYLEEVDRTQIWRSRMR